MQEDKGLPQVAPGVFITSVLNPSMRVFDVTMRTEYGTSYNSYAVVGSKQTALIDACHATFAGEWLAKVSAVLGGAAPDYLIMNHTEPDHSGAVAALLERWPQTRILLSSVGAVNLKFITNRSELNTQVVRDGDSLDLGDLQLQFIAAPFLHWPDTMFTWLPARKVLFSCDFLGTHFCEPQLFDHRVVYRRAFVSETRNYFDSIMGPFKSYVLQGLEKLAGIDADFICPSHGPILTKGCELENSLRRYREWATPKDGLPPRLNLFYCSAYGNTLRLSESISRGIAKVLPNAQLTSYNLVENDPASLAAALNDCDALLLGSPTINRDALPEVWNLLAEADAYNIAKRPVALFGSYGWSGEALPHLAQRLQDLKAKVFAPLLKIRFVPSPSELQAAEDFGSDFAKSLGEG